GQIGVSQHGFEPSGADAPRPFVGTFRRHHDVDAWPAGPNVEVLPLQDRVDLRAEVKRQRVIFDTEELHGAWGWHEPANLRGKAASLPHRFLGRQLPVQIEPPHERQNEKGKSPERQSCPRSGEHSFLSFFLLLFPPVLYGTADEQGCSGIRRQQVIRALELHTREKSCHGGQPNQSKSRLRVQSPLLPCPHPADAEKYEGTPGEKVPSEVWGVEPPRMRRQCRRIAQAAFVIVV